MLPHLHTTITNILHAQGGIPAEVAVRFEVPERDWREALTRPTLNFYLFDMQENAELRQADLQAGRAGGRTGWKMPPRRFDLRYMVAAFTGHPPDEQLLIWRTLAALLKHAPLPPDGMPEELRRLDVPLATKVLREGEGPRLLDLWGALELPPRPALLYVVTAPLDLELEFSAPLVLTRGVRYSRSAPNAEAAGRRIDPARTIPVAEHFGIGGIVHDQQGQPLAGLRVRIEGRAIEGVTDAQGRYKLAGLAAGPVRLLVERQNKPALAVAFAIPADSYDIELPQ